MFLYTSGTICVLHGTYFSWENSTLEIVSQRDYSSSFTQLFWIHVFLWSFRKQISYSVLLHFIFSIFARICVRDNLYSNSSLGSSRLCCGNKSLCINESPLMCHISEAMIVVWETWYLLFNSHCERGEIVICLPKVLCCTGPPSSIWAPFRGIV